MEETPGPGPEPAAGSLPAPGWPEGTTEADRRCWVCGGETLYRHCRIVCRRCGFLRDCSDP